jgi:hypothetical protein
VRDRWHNGAGHGFFLDPGFCNRFWIPFLRDGTFIPGADEPERPRVWLEILSTIKLKYVLSLLLILGTLGAVYAALMPPRGYIGCYAENNTADLYKTTGRDLNGDVVERANMTIEQCVNYCGSKGFSYAGLQFAKVCFCGETYGKFGISDACLMACPGNSKEICGGFFANSVYSTHESTPSSKPRQ